MRGRLNHEHGQLFYSFCLDEAVPDDHLVRQIAGVLDLSWVHCELAPYYAKLGRPSIDPVLMIRMLIIGYVFAIRSERALCRDVEVNFAYRWFCGLSIEDKIPDHSGGCFSSVSQAGPIRGFLASLTAVAAWPQGVIAASKKSSRGAL